MTEPSSAEIPKDLLERNLQLPTTARRKLAEILMESIEPETDVKAMLTKRWEDYQSGKTQPIEIDEFQAELRRRIAERRGK